jgi:hypothetical protein
MNPAATVARFHKALRLASYFRTVAYSARTGLTRTGAQRNRPAMSSGKLVVGPDNSHTAASEKECCGGPA